MAIETSIYYDEYKLYAQASHRQARRALFDGPARPRGMGRAVGLHTLRATSRHHKFCGGLHPAVRGAGLHLLAAGICHQPALHLLAALPRHIAPLAAPGPLAILLDRLQPGIARPA